MDVRKPFASLYLVSPFLMPFPAHSMSASVTLDWSNVSITLTDPFADDGQTPTMTIVGYETAVRACPSGASLCPYDLEKTATSALSANSNNITTVLHASTTASSLHADVATPFTGAIPWSRTEALRSARIVVAGNGNVRIGIPYVLDIDASNQSATDTAYASIGLFGFTDGLFTGYPKSFYTGLDGTKHEEGTLFFQIENRSASQAWTLGTVAAAGVIPLPEPETYLMLVSGMAVVVAGCWRQRKRASSSSGDQVLP